MEEGRARRFLDSIKLKSNDKRRYMIKMPHQLG
jgi:hypothetical protein